MAFFAQQRREAAFNREAQRLKNEGWEDIRDIKDHALKGVVFIHLIMKRDNEEENSVNRLGFNMKFPTTVWHAIRNAIIYRGHDPNVFKIRSIRLFDYQNNIFNPIPTRPKDVPMQQPSTIPLKIEVEVEKSNRGTVTEEVEKYERRHINDFWDENPPLVPRDYIACGKVLDCGHQCGGIRNEEECQPCIICLGAEAKEAINDLCPICQERIGASPFIQIRCSHFFHYNCLKSLLENRWTDTTINFGFMHCPLCKNDIQHASLGGLMQPLIALRNDVKEKALHRLEYEGLLNAPEITDKTSVYYKKPDEYAMNRYKFVMCNKCKKPYFFGMANCIEQLDPAEVKPENFRCGGCSHTVGIDNCPHHGKEYIEYKCRYCCSTAVWFCFGTTHFCDACHRDAGRLDRAVKENLPKCPVGGGSVQLPAGPCPLGLKNHEHPNTGEEFSLGCWMCFSIKD